ncbi:MAG: aminotransferase class V-fold PLP-dependent enzyme [Lachnospiraceae bacterium]|nr:aminotransferase class V-fold PLP-dependent enzyme [Lachnospiraceae bacterium]
MEEIYLDNAATTKPLGEAVDAMLPYMKDLYGNPSSVYSLARRSKRALDEARDACAKEIHANSSEVYFTSGGSESDNWALTSAFCAYKDRGNRIITTAIEHPAILNTCRILEKEGAEIVYLPVDSLGRVDPEDAEKAMTDKTILVSVMTANNEVGTIEPIREIGAIAHRHGAIFHTDAVQAYGHIPIDVEKDNIDLLSASGHKFHGPKGCGIFYIKNGVRIGSFVHGGAQERGRRAGTENVASIVGMGAAASFMSKHREDFAGKEAGLRDYAMERLENEIDGVAILGDRRMRLPQNIDILIDGVEGESLLIMLDQRGICASSGSACSSGSLDPSHVLLAMGIPEEKAYGALRLTMSFMTTKKEIDLAIDAIRECVVQLRA